ncbi:hypothetical protein RirG_204050 [Rhizophagus irregularis DAOM 197198w]|uniref:Protein far1-related sequence 11-like n=1 Tax=Rhizophagus irregularis (strain DAOM 197198w) TaxID=1432141 RepID=A0A015IKS0_RHIIW|nr:hypothetical protein RirG_204050 [Rhizophagus irregularis DAOM 197198w]
MSSPNPPVFLEHKLDKLYESNVYEPEYVVNITEDEENGNLSLQVGQTFETFEEVEAFLAQYCEQNGFEYRKRRVEYDDNNIIRKRTYECTKASQYQPKKDKDPEKHRNQSSGSIGCQWHLNVTCLKSTNITIRITKVVDEHNHPLSSNIKIHGPQFRQFSKEMKSDILEYLSAVPTMGARTLYGLLKVKRSARLQEKDDAQNMLQELYDLQRKEPGWIIETRIIGNDFRLGSILWMSPQQVQLWIRFHDVVITDDTYKTNRYDMALSLFMVIDNHNRTRIVAQALIEDETESTFQWILDCILRATNFIFPRVIFTDRDLAMAAAIKAKMPDTHHCICVFHINQNFIKNLKGKLPQSYLQNKLYPIRFSWAHCYTQVRFIAGVTTTQRAESKNNVLKLDDLHTFSLVQLTHQINVRIEEEKRYTEFENEKN